MVTCPTNTMLPTVTDIAGNAVLAFPDNLTTSNTKIRHGHNDNLKMNDDVMLWRTYIHSKRHLKEINYKR